MTVNELRKLLEGLDGDMEVHIPVSHEFDGYFYSPCAKESGVMSSSAEYISDEDIKEAELLGKEIPLEKSFLLAPEGFSDSGESDNTIDPRLN